MIEANPLSLRDQLLQIHFLHAWVWGETYHDQFNSGENLAFSGIVQTATCQICKKQKTRIVWPK